MRRRSVLHLTAAGAALPSISGCVDLFDSSEESDEPAGNDPISLDSLESPTLDDGCGPAALPLFALLVEDGRCTGPWFDETDAVSLAIENERNEAVTATVEVTDDDAEVVHSATHHLEPGERIVESSTIQADEDHDVVVTVDDDSTAGTWEGVSCLRHGIALRPEGIAIGYVEPSSVNCYPGDSSSIGVFTAETGYDVSVHVRDRCSGETAEAEFELDAEDGAWFEELLEIGGVFDVTVDVDGGGTLSEEFREFCPTITADVDEDGAIELYSTGWE